MMAGSMPSDPDREASMPTYDYDCDRCGSFSESHPIAEFDAAAAMPGLRRSGAARADQPGDRRRTRRAREPATPFRSHPGGCSCCAAPRRFAAEAV